IRTRSSNASHFAADGEQRAACFARGGASRVAAFDRKLLRDSEGRRAQQHTSCVYTCVELCRGPKSDGGGERGCGCDGRSRRARVSSPSLVVGNTREDCIRRRAAGELGMSDNPEAPDDSDWPRNYFNYFTEVEEHF